VKLTKNILSIFALSEHHSPGIGSHLVAEEIIQGSKILDRKGGKQLLKQSLSSHQRRTDNNNIIYVDEHIDGETSRMEHKQRRINLRRFKPQLT
jgi:hypothetical protein